MAIRKAESISYLSPKEIEAYLKKVLGEKELYGSIIENIENGIAVINKQMELIYFNRNFESLMNFQVQKNKSPFYSELINIELKKFFEISGKSWVSCEREFKIGINDPKIYISVRGCVLSNDSYMYIIKDITQRKKEFYELKRLESLAAVSSIAPILAHDINNPLSAIAVQADLIKRGIDKLGNDFVVEHMDIIKNEITRIKDIVQGFLFSSRPLEATPILQDPQRLIDELTKFIQPDLDQKNIQLQCDIQKPLPYIDFDFNLIYSCLLNLIKNSVEAIGNKHGKRIIGLKAYRHLNNLLICVEDTGCGIKEEDAEKIFKPYFTTKDKGTGLGLSNVYKVIKMHNGDIELSTKEGEEGVKFSIYLPLRKEDRLALSKDNKTEK